MDKTDVIEPEILPKYQPKTLQAMKLVDAGLPAKEALQAVNLKSNVTRAAVSRFKDKYKKYQLINPKTVKLAENQIKRILKGEAREVTQQKVSKDGEVVEYTEQIAPSDTNIIAAATMVYDRYEPVVKQVLNVNVDVDPVDLGAFKNE